MINLQTWKITSEDYPDIYFPIDCSQGVILNPNRFGDKFQVIHLLTLKLPEFNPFKTLTVTLESQINS